jgi:hypothetical protein
MAFENFWKRGRERYGGDRNPEQQWRSSENEWRERADQGRYGQQDDYRRRMSGGEDDEGRRGWRQGSDYYRNPGYRGSQQEDRSSREGYRSDYFGGRAREEGQDYGADFGERNYASGNYGRDFSDDKRGGAYGSGGYGGDFDYGRRGSAGVSGAEYGSSRYGQGEEFRGKGPKGYRRSDERIREDICDILTEDPYIDASNLEVTVKECEVTLSGSVNSREDKRRAEDLVESCSGVKDVHNTLRVTAEQRGMSQGLEQSGQQGAGQQGTQSGQQARH